MDHFLKQLLIGWVIIVTMMCLYVTIYEFLYETQEYHTGPYLVTGFGLGIVLKEYFIVDITLTDGLLCVYILSVSITLLTLLHFITQQLILLHIFTGAVVGGLVNKMY